MPTVEELRVAFDNQISAGVNAATGDLNKFADATERAGQATDAHDQVIRRATPTIEALSRRWDGDAAALARREAAIRKNEAALASIAAAEAKAGGVTEQTTALHQRAAQQLQIDIAAADKYGQSVEQRFAPANDKITASAGNAAFAMRQLGVQSMQAISGIATGQSVLQVFIQQGHQVADVALSTGTGFSVFGAAARAVGGFLAGPGGLVVAGVAATAALGALASMAESTQSRMLGLQAALRGTRDDYVAMASEANSAARAIASSGQASLADATAAARTLAAQVGFHGTQQQLQGLITTANDLATIMGTKLPEEAVKLAAAMNDPGKMAQELADIHFKGMNYELARSIELQAASGDKAGAYAKLLDALHVATSGAAQASKTELQKALDELSGQFIKSGGDGRGFFETIGNGITHVATVAIEKVTAIIQALKDAKDYIANIPGVGSAASAVSSSMPSWSEFFSNLSGIPILKGAFSAGAAPVGGALQGAWNWIQGGGSGHLYNGGQSGSGMTADSLLPLIMQYESGGQNIPNYRYDPTHTAQGYYQITNSTWRDIAPGIGAGQYSNAMSAPFDVQTAVAAALLQQRGLQPWSTNASLMNAVGGGGGANFSGSGLLNLNITGNAAINVDAASASPVTAGPTPTTATAQAIADPTLAARKIDEAVHLAMPGSAIKSFDDANAAIRRDVEALNLLKAQGITTGNQVRVLTDDLNKQNAALTAAVSPIQGIINALNIQTKAEEAIAAAWDRGALAAANTNLQIKAEADLRKAGGEALAQNATAVAALTAKYIEVAQAAEDAALAQKASVNRDTIDFLNAEIASLTDSVEVRNRNLAVLKATQDIQRNEPHASEERKQAAIAEAARIADLTTQYQQQQQAIQTLGGMASSIFSTIADDISQAFISGQSAAITFSNITKAVLTQLVKDIIQLSVIGPVMNSLFGTNQTTLGQVLSIGSAAGGGTGGTSAGGSSILGTLSTGSSLVSGGSSLLQALGYQGLGGQINGLLGGPGTSLFASSSGQSLFGGVGSSITGILNTPLIGTSAEATNAALSSLGAGVYGPETASQFAAAGGGTLGSLIGGVGGGFALGSLSGSLIQGSLNKTGPAPEIGAGTGAIAGAILGSIIAPEFGGTLWGGLLGGLLGGSGGGLIGPHPASAYSMTEVGLDNGLLSIGKSLQQRDQSSLPQTQADVDALNAFLRAHDLQITSIAPLGQIGQNTPGGFIDPTKFGSIAEALPNFKFTSSSDATFAKYLGGQSFPDSNALQNAVAEYQNLISTTIPALTAEAKVTGSLNDALTQINTTFQAAIDTANKYGVATDDLTAAQDKAIDKAQAAAQAQADAMGAQIEQRDVAARMALGAAPGAAEAAALKQFDAGLQTQRDQYRDQLVGIFGDSFKDTQDFADRMAALERTLGDERLAIVKQYGDQIAAAQKAISDTDVSLVSRAMKANAQISGKLEDQLGSALYDFDVNAESQRATVLKQFEVLYGDTAAQHLDYQNELLQLEKTLGLERLAITKSYTDQITARDEALAKAQQDAIDAANAADQANVDAVQQMGANIQAQADAAMTAMAAQTEQFYADQTAIQAKAQADALAAQQAAMDQASAAAAQTITSLVSYAQSLQTSSASPLSPVDQYALAQRQFNAVAGAAGAGDYNSLTQLQTYANSFLSTSRVVNGSGASYANDFGAVLDALNKAATVAPDTLTSSVLRMETRTQTATLVDQLTALRAAVDAVTAQLRQNGAAPARIAA